MVLSPLLKVFLFPLCNQYYCPSFSIEDRMEITGESREELIKRIEEMRADAQAAGKNPDDYAVLTTKSKVLYFPDGFTS